MFDTLTKNRVCLWYDKDAEEAALAGETAGA